MISKKFDISVLCLRDFRLMMITGHCNSLAWNAQAAIIGWQVYSLTHSAMMLGLAALTEAAPAIVAALFVGHIVDTREPRRIYAASIFALGLNIIAQLFVAGGFAGWSDHSVLTFIFCSVVISGFARTFMMSASFALMPSLVSRDKIPAAQAWGRTSIQVAITAGPALAGLLYGGYGAAGAWMFPAFLSVSSMFCVCFIKAPYERSTAKRAAVWTNIRDGWKFLLETPVLLALMALDTLTFLFGGVFAILPVYADQVLHVGAQGLGILRAAPGVGGILIALLLSVRPMKRVTAIHMFWSITAFGLCMIGFGVSHVFWLSIVFLIAGGTFDSIGVLINGTLMQLLTPDNMRGRVSAVQSIFFTSTNEIGAFESGIAAQVLGLVPSVVFGGCVTLLVVAVMAVISPKLRKTVVEA